MSVPSNASYKMIIGGQPALSNQTIDVINPATGENFNSAPDCSSEQLDEAMLAAERACTEWQKNLERRREVLRACSEAITGHAEQLSNLLTLEQGKPLTSSRIEIRGSAKWFDYTSKLEFPVEIALDNDRVRIEVHRKPCGVVAAITPWNYPVSLAVWKIAPALLAGNTMVLKPSPFTPLSTLLLGEILSKVVPAGVLNIVSGGDALGAKMTVHPLVRKISFTGSVSTGKLVARAAADDLKRVTLELGGNDPAIILPDVDPAAIAKRIFWGAFENAGQVCSAIKRVYVPTAKYEDFLEQISSIAKKVQVGNGLDESTKIGPINNKPQFERVTELVEDARDHGARIVTGGNPVGQVGYLYQPTVVGDISDGIRLVDEEQFGPVLPIVPYENVEDVITSANKTHFGLGGSVWSNDTDLAVEVAGRLECGTAWINQHLNILPHAPFGGAKWSGIGVENGPWGLLGFTEIQTVNTAKPIS